MDHNKQIRQIASAGLKPQGLFQKGNSRMWIDDNGWFLILVEFQPGSWAGGSYSNVGIHYLWDDVDYLKFDYGYRVGGFVDAQTEKTFSCQIERLANMAVDQVKKYRKFQNLDYAKKRICKKEAANAFATSYARGMICALSADPRAEVFFQDAWKLSSLAQFEKYHTELSREIVPILRDPQALQTYVLGKIDSQREFWRGKSGMKKLRETVSLI